jgi:pyruvate,water dikinase
MRSNIAEPSMIRSRVAWARSAGAAPDDLRGAPASAGEATGPARIVRDSDDAALVQPGDIVVCVMSTPAWAQLLSVAAGVITEVGAVLANPATVAREYGIPAVVAVKDATARIRDGQIVTIDGARGCVSLQG